MNFELIKKLATDNKISITEIANQIGMSRGGLNTAIYNQTLTIVALEKIAKVLDVPVNVFFNTEQYSNKTKIEQLEERIYAIESKISQKEF